MMWMWIVTGLMARISRSCCRRELKSALLPPNAQTWVNRHVPFTHGNGVVMSPVTRKNPKGLPTFYLQDIPTVSTGGPPNSEMGLLFWGGGPIDKS